MSLRTRCRSLFGCSSSFVVVDVAYASGRYELNIDRHRHVQLQAQMMGCLFVDMPLRPKLTCKQMASGGDELPDRSSACFLSSLLNKIVGKAG